MVLDSAVDRRLVKDAIPDETINDTVDLSQQCRHLRWVLLMTFRHGGGDNAAMDIHPDVQFLPTPGSLFAVFLAMPFALTADLSPRTVDDQVNRSL
jgi:hypothetical protein